MEYTEHQIRKAIAIAIKAKKIEENLVVIVDDDLGIEIKEPVIKPPPSAFYKKLKTSVDKKREEVSKAKEAATRAKWVEEDIERYEETRARRKKMGWE